MHMSIVLLALLLIGPVDHDEKIHVVGVEIPPPSLCLSEVRGGVVLDETLGWSCLPDDYVAPPGKGILRGHVMVGDGKGEMAEPFVNVNAREAHEGAFTAKDGVFELPAVPAGWQMIVFSHVVDFEPIRVCVDVAPEDTTEVVLVLKRLGPN